MTIYMLGPNLCCVKMKKILMLGVNFHPEIISTAVYSSGLAEYLADSGREVSVVTANPYYPEWKVHPGWQTWRYSNRKYLNTIRVTHCPLYVPSSPSFVKRILHHVSFELKSSFAVLEYVLSNRPDFILVVGPSLMSAPLALSIARILRLKTWLHVQDFEVEAAFATGMIRKNSLLLS